MNAKVLSITNDYYEIKEFLYKYDFINEEQYNDDGYDLLVWLEDGCDRITCEGEELYFGEFHSDYVWDNCLSLSLLQWIIWRKTLLLISSILITGHCL